MKQFRISIHSIVDLITNSSSETYISASENTVDVIKKFIEALLNSFNIDENVEDLFEIYISNKAAYEDFLSYEEDFDGEMTEKRWLEEFRSEDETPLSDVVVIAKDERCKVAAEILSTLGDTFNADDYCS